MQLKLLDDTRYCEEMERQVLPFLSRRRITHLLKTRDGLTLYAESYRAENPRAGVVIVHGFTETAEKYRELIWYFLGEGISVYIYDGRGHGRSSRETENIRTVHVNDFMDYVRDLDQVAREIAIPQIGNLPLYLFAHSMGGAVAALYLEQYPDAFSRAVLSSPMISPRTGGIPKRIARAVADGMVRRGKGEEMIFIFRDDQEEKHAEDSACDSRSRFEYYAERRRENPRLQTTGASWAWLAAALRGTENLAKRENAEKIRIPVLLFQAGIDKFVETRAQDRFIARVPDGRIVRYPFLQHELYRTKNENLEQYLKTLFDFLS